MSGAPCPIKVMRKVIDEMGIHQLTIAYGQTEASPVVTQTHVMTRWTYEWKRSVARYPASKSKSSIRHRSIIGLKNDKGNLLPRPCVMLAVLQNPAATSAAIDKEGWLHSGDLAVRLPNGYYKITGRLKDMADRGAKHLPSRNRRVLLQPRGLSNNAL